MGMVCSVHTCVIELDTDEPDVFESTDSKGLPVSLSELSLLRVYSCMSCASQHNGIQPCVMNTKMKWSSKALFSWSSVYE